jgi:4-nitrophenyl phosphatase
MIRNGKIEKSAIRGLIIDIDGVLWRGAKPVGDLAAVFGQISSLGWRAILATNNARSTPHQYLDKMKSFGVTLEPWQVINSAQAAAYELKRRFPEGGAVYAVGEEGLLSALDEQGFYQAEEGVLAVVAGLDTSFTYHKLRTANRLIRSGALFLGTNPDPTLPTPGGEDPGAGSILASIAASSGQEPQISGKPNPGMYQAALERLQTQASETLVVGDRLSTDIAGAQNLGCPNALVLSGVTTLEEAQVWQPLPDLIAQDLGEVVQRDW